MRNSPWRMPPFLLVLDVKVARYCVFVNHGSWVCGRIGSMQGIALVDSISSWTRGWVVSYPLYSDSQSAIHLAENDSFHARMKHIDVKYHDIRLWLKNKEFELVKIHTDCNPADILMKVVTLEKPRLGITSIGLCWEEWGRHQTLNTQEDGRNPWASKWC